MNFNFYLKKLKEGGFEVIGTLFSWPAFFLNYKLSWFQSSDDSGGFEVSVYARGCSAVPFFVDILSS